MKSVIFTFGKFNPPTFGHEKLFEFMAEQANGANVIIGTSKKSDPIDLNLKLELLEKIRPDGVEVQLHQDPFVMLEKLIKEDGYTDLQITLGSDRADSAIGRSMAQYAERWGANSFDVLPFGSKRDAYGNTRGLLALENISSTAMRAAIHERDFLVYMSMMPSKISIEQASAIVEIIKEHDKWLNLKN